MKGFVQAIISAMDLQCVHFLVLLYFYFYFYLAWGLCLVIVKLLPC